MVFDKGEKGIQCKEDECVLSVSDSVTAHGLQPARLLSTWNFPGKNTGVRCHCLLQITALSISYQLYLEVQAESQAPIMQPHNLPTTTCDTNNTIE